MEHQKKFSNKIKIEKFEWSHSAKNFERADPLGFLTSIRLQIIKKFKGTFGDIEKFWKKVSQSRKAGSPIVPKMEMGSLLLWNGFVFHGCVQNQVLSTYGKSAQCTKSGPIAFN